MSQFDLPMVPLLVDFWGIVEVWVKDGIDNYRYKKPNGRIPVKRDPDSQPRVIVQAKHNNGQPYGPPFTFDYEADSGRGVWVIYDENLHKEPAAPVVEGAKSAINLGSSSKIELSAKTAPALDVPLEDESPEVVEEVDAGGDDDNDCDEVTSEGAETNVRFDERLQDGTSRPNNK